ncbi:MAG: PD-(D/E)XK nuclease family transposase [Paludibacteraceae bacterium]|jgi:hypothetical protein|nr:PD-(D/E)XK nuclease family transposase [Paludibacteraceae bacterium]
MQGRSQVFFRDRILYYLSRALAGQGLRGADWNYKLTPVYGVYLMNFSLSGDEQIIDDVSLYSKCQLGKGVNAKPFSDKIRVITISFFVFLPCDGL